MTFLELADGTRIRYSKRGSGEKVFVLIHGWKQSHRLFDQVTNLLSRNHTVLTFDQRGMGESDKPDSHYDFQILSEDLHQILNHFDLWGVTLLGWSMGCTTSLSYLQRHTDRVARVALLNGPIRLTKATNFEFALEQEALSSYIRELELEWPRHERAWYEGSVLPKNAYLVDLLLNVGLQTPLDVALKLVREQEKIDHRQTIRDLNIPVLAIYSECDPYWPISLGEWIVKNSRFGSALYLADSAHCAPLEESKNLSNILVNFSKVAS